MTEYGEILKQWAFNELRPAVYDNLDSLFPRFQFRRMSVGTSKDRWVSRFKKDGSMPKVKNAEKTVVYFSDMRFREQGEWNDGTRILDMVMQEYGISDFKEVYAFLCDRLHLEMPKQDSAEVKKAIQRSKTRADVLQSLQECFVWGLENGRSDAAKSVRNYLTGKRGFTAEQIKSLGFGFCPSWDIIEKRITQDLKYPKEVLDEVCRVRSDEGKTTVGKYHTLTIPYRCGEMLKGFLFRRVDNEHPKYFASIGLDRKSFFFNIPSAADSIIVVEGEMDALTATAAGIPGVVAVGGSEIAGDRIRQIYDALGRGVRKITLCFDLDAVAGSGDPNYAARYEHVIKSIHTIKEADIHFDDIYVAALDSICDPDEFIRSRGVDAFKKLISEAMPYWEFIADYKKIIGK